MLDEYLIRGDIMALDIEENTKSPKIEYQISKVIELFSLIHVLAEPTHHKHLHDFIKRYDQTLSKESQSLLRIIEKFPFNGLGLFEYVLAINELGDINIFIDKFAKYENHQIVSVFTDKLIDQETYQKLLSHEIGLSFIEKKYPWLYTDSVHELDFLIFETAQFKAQLINLLQELNQMNDFHQEIENHRIDYLETTEKIKQQLKTTKPLDVAQAIMGKKFGRVFNYPLYIFCPSYFCSPHRIRIHNENRMIIIYDIFNDYFTLNQKGEEISNTLKVISDRTRLEILRRLSSGPTYGKLLANSLDLTTATISHHLEQLKSVGLVNEEKKKNTKYFSLNKKQFEKILQLTDEYILKQ